MKDNLYRFIILTLICVIIFNYTNHKRSLNHNTTLYNNTLKEYKDLNDSTYKLKQIISLNDKELKHLNDTLYSLRKTLKDKPIYISKTSTELNRSYHLNPDTVLKTVYIYKDSYTDIKLYNDSIPKVNLKILTDINYNIIEKDKRLYSIIHLSNPDIKISNTTGFIYELNKSNVFKEYLKRKDKRFGLGFYIGYGFNGKSFEPSIGLSINYNILRF